MGHSKQTTINNQSGFTLVEAIVTIAIMLILMGIILSGLNDAKQRFAVRDSAQQIANTIRQAILDTKNGIKIADTRCEPDDTITPRQCSNYIISIGNGVINKFVTGSNTNYSAWLQDSVKLLGGTDTSEAGIISFVYSTKTFPFVNATLLNGSFPVNSGIITITVKSMSNNNISTNVCINKTGAVLVQSGPCL